MSWTITPSATLFLAAILTGLAGCATPSLPSHGTVQVDRWATIRAADKDVSEILDAFDRAGDALHRSDLDGLMALYSDGYRYHGLSKDELRAMWRDIFDRYDRVAGNHIFSRIQVVASGATPTAEIICTGNLWGLAKETGKQTLIDSWFYETHYLTYEGGAWRIHGHGEEDIPKGLPFSSSPHPFF